eukprot:CAMPEP_0202497082 /NCGR_PEP_ID=MMETSP1361-20130828/21834_1 /ASSEMBLY_ACC=CAM_ASM_000849 /TAXON_ID=210615 /ORGANISM="Staurosira complex sp., Strain CCMP2646" /LENGTH=239 /DNA_ID=CAMNT_0049128589 /DNA_START=183 /DNA_END=902 /DNA_ORIENTATION=-
MSSNQEDSAAETKHNETETVESKPEIVTLEDGNEKQQNDTNPATPATLSLNEDTAATGEESPGVEEQAPTPEETNGDTVGKDEQPLAEKEEKKSRRVPFQYNPDKVTLRFIFANNDGLSVTLDCEPADTVGEVKGALLSVWPKELPDCGGGDRLRLICMGKGMLTPDSKTIQDCQIPTFKTHATPVNVSVRPEIVSLESIKSDSNNPNGRGSPRRGGGGNRQNGSIGGPVEQGCSCVIL